MERATELFKTLQGEGLAAIERLYDDKEAEKFFLDFKRSDNDGDGKKLSPSDRNNFGKALSAFGNSEGGVVIWGIDCRPGTDGADLVQAKRPLTNPKRFASWLNGAVSGLTFPPIEAVDNLPIEEKSGSGYVASFIPKSINAPLQAAYDNRFYIRAGSDSIPAHRETIAGMFGRRPQPRVEGRFVLATPCLLRSRTNQELNVRGIEVPFLLGIKNIGAGIANDVFAVMYVESLPGPNCNSFMKKEQNDSWSAQTEPYTNRHEGEQCITAIGNPNFRMPPYGQMRGIVGRFEFLPPFDREFSFWIRSGSSGCPTDLMNFSAAAKEVEHAHAQAVKYLQGSSASRLKTGDKRSFTISLNFVGNPPGARVYFLPRLTPLPPDNLVM